jgi:hypothetical protein
MLLIDHQEKDNLQFFLAEENGRGNQPLHAAVSASMWPLAERLIRLGAPLYSPSHQHSSNSPIEHIIACCGVPLFDILSSKIVGPWTQRDNHNIQSLYLSFIRDVNIEGLTMLKRLSVQGKIYIDFHEVFEAEQRNALSYAIYYGKEKNLRGEKRAIYLRMISLLVDL